MWLSPGNAGLWRGATSLRRRDPHPPESEADTRRKNPFERPRGERRVCGHLLGEVVGVCWRPLLKMRRRRKVHATAVGRSARYIFAI